jgi:hypothetical protein
MSVLNMATQHDQVEVELWRFAMGATRPGAIRDRVLACTPDNALPVLNRLEQVCVLFPCLLNPLQLTHIYLMAVSFMRA